MKPTEALVDADSLCYLGTDPEEDPSYICRSVRLILEEVQEGTYCDEMKLYLSSEINFRYDIFPEYKANRKDLEKPPHYETIKNYLRKYWEAETCPDGYEADDWIAMQMLERGDEVCVVSNDKDFLTVPGWHYKMRFHNEHNLFYVDKDDAEAFMCYQLLTGDKADGIISPLKTTKKDGTYSKLGFGDAKARDFLLQYEYEDMREAVRKLYIEQGHEEFFNINEKLLGIGRTVL